MKSDHIASVCCVSLFLVPGFVTSVEAATLIAVADTYVRQGSADTNFGTTTSIQATNDGGSAISKEKDALALIRFDLSSYTDPLDSATLTLDHSSASSSDFNVYGINNGSGDENFVETGLTFNNADTATTATNGSIDVTNLTLLGSFSTTGAGLVNFSSPGLNSFLSTDLATGNNLATFVIFRTTENGNASNFSSRESTIGTKPTLTLIPEPGTLALGLAGLVLACARRRRN